MVRSLINILIKNKEIFSNSIATFFLDKPQYTIERIS
jgi:hypothetical protein